jgi:hypothetical protein
MAVNHRSIIGDAIRDLHSDSVTITLIVGDNHAVQVPPLASSPGFDCARNCWNFQSRCDTFGGGLQSFGAR